MRSLVLSAAITLAFASASFAQTEVLRGTSTNTAKKATSSKPAVQKATTTQQRSVQPVQRKATTPQTLRGSRYGGFAPSAPVEPPTLDLVSPRSLSLVNANSGETLTVTYWSNGGYHRDALDKLNHFLRDTRDNAQTEMDPLLFDVVWHTQQITGHGGHVEVLSAYRSPTTNAWLASVSRGVARDSQHMNGNAMDIRFPGVPVFKIRQAARALNMGGVGFYPRSGFVHLDTGPIRYW
jgi:uncharacterized protein YcbK (DUF882 family)